MTMNTRLSFAVVFSMLIFSICNDAIAQKGSVQYNPGKGKSDYRQYCPAVSASGSPTSYAPQGVLIKKISAAKDKAYKNAWSGTRKDLEAIVANAEKIYGFDGLKHLGRNATMLVPATKQEMEWVINHGGMWERYEWDSEHQEKKGHNTKYINRRTKGEAVYNDVTGMIVTNEKLGTRNFGEPGETFKPSTWIAITPWGDHKKLDMRPHNEKADPSDKLSRDGDQYKYVGILYEHDPNYPDMFYVIDGQTGLPMTPQQVAEMPTTLSDMWKDMGLVCVKNDAKDIVPPKDPLASSGLKRAEGCEDKNKNERKICSCVSPDVFFAGVCRKKIGVLDKLWAQHYCRKCGGFRRGDLMDLIKTDKGIAVYPAGVVPSDWDGKVYEQSELDAHVRGIVK